MKTIAILLVLTMVSIVGHAQDVEVDPPEGRASPCGDSLDVYEFPIIPGTPEWRELPGHRARVEACQIPDGILAEMSTEGLVETCMRYPHRNLWAVSSTGMLVGIQGIIDGFNGLSELMTRPDAGVALLNAYQSNDPARIPSDWAVWDDGDRALVMDLTYLELLLGQEPVLSGMPPGAKLALIELCLKNRSSRGEYAIDGSSAVLVGRTLMSMGYEPFMREWEQSEALQSFLETALRMEPLEEMTQSIRCHAEQCLAKRRKEEGR